MDDQCLLSLGFQDPVPFRALTAPPPATPPPSFTVNTVACFQLLTSINWNLAGQASILSLLLFFFKTYLFTLNAELERRERAASFQVSRVGAGAHALALSLLLLQAFLRELREVMEPGFSSLSLRWDSCELDSVTTLTPETVMIIVYFFIGNIEHFT